MKSKLNPEMIHSLSTYIENGASNQDACVLCGIAEPTFYMWLKQGEKDLNDPTLEASTYELELYKSIQNAHRKFKVWHVNNIMKASKHDWKASAWLLSHCFPQEFSDKAIENKLNETTTIVKPVEVEFVKSDLNSERVKNMQKIVDAEVKGKEV